MRRSSENALMAGGGPKGNKRHPQNQPAVPQPVPAPPLPPPPAGKKKRRNRNRQRARSADDEEGSEEVELDLGELMKKLALQNQAPVLSYPAVIKVFATIQEPDFENPWQMGGVQQATGSGVVIGGKKILTAAHVVADQTFLQVQKTDINDPELRPARVFAVSHECDLALLELEEDDATFYQGIDPMDIGELPHLRDKVYVAGFPVGGEELSITEGVVSRIEGQPYEHSQHVLLAVTVDAAINAGNSGGPVFSTDSKLIGIAFQAMVGAENTGHIIPPPVIRHFLEGVKRAGPANYLGFPSLGVEVQHLLNPLLRLHLGMTADQSGVLVTNTIWGNTAHKILQKGDVVLAMGNTNGGKKKIANNGTIPYGDSHRVDFLIDVTLFQCGEKLHLSVLRDKKVIDVTLTLQPQFDLVPLAQHDILPPYYVYCGMVFQLLSLDYITNVFAAGGGQAPKSLLVLFESSNPSEERQEVILLSQVLTHSVNTGYDELLNSVITSVNGKKMASLHTLVAEIESSTADEIELKTSDDVMMILPGPKTQVAKDANEKIAARYRVTADRSNDLAGPCGKVTAENAHAEFRRKQQLRHHELHVTKSPSKPSTPAASPATKQTEK